MSNPKTIIDASAVTSSVFSVLGYLPTALSVIASTVSAIWVISRLAEIYFPVRYAAFVKVVRSKLDRSADRGD